MSYRDRSPSPAKYRSRSPRGRSRSPPRRRSRSPNSPRRARSRDRRDDYERRPRGGDMNLEMTEELRRNTTSLFVGNLPFTFREREVAEMFERCGPIRNVSVGMNRRTSQSMGYSFVEFEDRRDAEDAMDRYQGYDVEGRRLRLDWDIGLNKKMKYLGGPAGAYAGGGRRRRSPPPRYYSPPRYRSRPPRRRRSRSPSHSPRRSVSPRHAASPRRSRSPSPARRSPSSPPPRPRSRSPEAKRRRSRSPVRDGSGELSPRQDRRVERGADVD